VVKPVFLIPQLHINLVMQAREIVKQKEKTGNQSLNSTLGRLKDRR
jgi:hypothetical protein